MKKTTIWGEHMKNIWIKKDQDMFIDEQGVSWESPKSWLWTGILGGCGCGNSDDFGDLAWNVLDLFSQEIMERKWSVYDDPKYEIIAHWLDSKGLLEHGGSVAGSWLSELGEKVHKNIKDLLV